MGERKPEPNVHPEQERDLRERASHIRVVADVGDRLAAQHPDALAHGERIGETGPGG